MKIGIQKNKVLCIVSGCRVFRDMRRTVEVDDTRLPENMVLLTKPIRKAMAEHRAVQKEILRRNMGAVKQMLEARA